MRLSLSRTLRRGSSVPKWLMAQFDRLSNFHHNMQLADIAEIAQPVWTLPRGLRVAALAFGLVALVGGIRALDAQIATLGDAIPPAAVEPATSSVSPEGLQAAPPPHTALMVEQIPRRLARAQTHRFFAVSVTAYTSEASQTDDSPGLTAIRRATRPGTIALSRDLLRNFTPGAPFAFGDCVLIPGMGIYVVEDTMHPKWTHKADIWFPDGRTARRWGRRDVYLARVEAEEPLLTATDWHR